MVADTLFEMAEGTTIQVTVLPEELTTTQAAEELVRQAQELNMGY